MVGVENLTEGYTEHFATLVESGFYHATEQLLVATKISHFVTRHGDSAKRRVALFLRHSLEIDACVTLPLHVDECESQLYSNISG